MTPDSLTNTMTEQGFVIFPHIYSASDCMALEAETGEMIVNYYNRDELMRHSVYPSDSSETRTSHAFMIAEADGPLPTVDHSHLPTISRFLRDHNQQLTALNGSAPAPSDRCMLNFQKYLTGSKPVAEHFDGEYLKTKRLDDGEFTLLEGILPRYVAVLVTENHNDGAGIELLDKSANVTYAPTLHGGDLVLFDNIRLRHRVPLLAAPRTTIGLRSFDFQPYHYAANETQFLGSGYQQTAEGWVNPNIDCKHRLTQFMADEWPLLRSDYSHYF